MKYAWVLLTMLCLTGCYEIDEEIVIQDDGSGTYTSHLDLGKLLDMLQNFGGDDALTQNGLDKPIDTTILMKNISGQVKDSMASSVPWKGAAMDIHLNAPAKQFVTNTTASFRGPNDLQQLMASSGIAPGMEEVFREVFGKKGPAGATTADSPSQPGMAQMSRVFDITVSNGLITKKLNMERYRALMESNDLKMARKMNMQGIELVYSTKIRLPRPAKKISNPLLQLSADKKTVTALFNAVDLIDHPDKFSYTIEY